MKSKGLIKVLAIIGLVIGFIGLVLAFLPLGLIAIIPAGIGFLLGLLAYFASKNVEMKKTLIYIVLVISLGSIFIAGFKTIFIQDKIEVDSEFIEKQDNSLDDSIESLDEISDELDSELEKEIPNEEIE